MALRKYKPEIKPGCGNSSSTLSQKLVKVRGINDKIRVEEEISLKDPKVQNNQSLLTLIVLL